MTTPDTTANDLNEYARTASPQAFASLVRTHVAAVHCQCLRQLRDPGAAEDVTQQVFITLAQKAAGIPSGVVLNGWLFTTTRYCCNNYKRAAMRRAAAEQKAAAMRNESVQHSSSDDDFAARATPILDDAIAGLAPLDRDAVLLRFFHGQTLRQVGSALGVSEDAAKQRVCRAVEKLRVYFARRGMTASPATLGGFLAGAIRPAAPHIAQAAMTAGISHGGGASAGHAAGIFWRSVYAWPKAAAAVAACAALTAAVAIAGHDASAQTPVSPTAMAALPIPATQPLVQDTPIAAMKSLIHAFYAMDFPAIDQCLYDDGTDPAAARLGRIYVEAEAAEYRVCKSWQDKFGVDLSVSGINLRDFPTGGLDLILASAADASADQVKIDGDTAHVRVALPPETFAGTGANRNAALGRWSGAMVVLNQVDGHWKLNTYRTFNFVLNIDRLPGNDNDAVESMTSIGEQMRDMLDAQAVRIDAGQLATPEQAANAVKAGVMRAMRDSGLQGGSVMALPIIGG